MAGAVLGEGVGAIGGTAKKAIPLPVKLAYTAFAAVWAPTYLYFYGPTNFLYFCDVALIITLVGIWTESAFLVSMCAVGILGPQALWVADFAGTAIGHPIVGMTAYMFNSESSLFLRLLSLFHGWLPFLLAYLVWRTGYDRRAYVAWAALGVALLAFCWGFMPPPRPGAGYEPVNINYVWGTSDEVAQTMMPPLAWLAGLMLAIPVVLGGLTHLLLRHLVPPPRPAAS